MRRSRGQNRFGVNLLPPGAGGPGNHLGVKRLPVMLDVSDWVMRACCRDFGAGVIGVRAPDLALHPSFPRRRESRIHHSVGCVRYSSNCGQRDFTAATLWFLAWVPACAGTTRGRGKAPRRHTTMCPIRDASRPFKKTILSVPCPPRLAALPPRKARRASQKTGGKSAPHVRSDGAAGASSGRPRFSRSTGHHRRRRRRTGARPGVAFLCLLSLAKQRK